MEGQMRPAFDENVFQTKRSTQDFVYKLHKLRATEKIGRAANYHNILFYFQYNVLKINF